MANPEKLPRSLVLDAIELTRQAAISCHAWIGKGNEKDADLAAVTAMRKTFNHIPINGRIVIGEGERDQAPMLYIDEELGMGKTYPAIDIAVDPLEGTTICAHAGANSISVLAMAERGALLHAPDVYMEKIAVGGNLPKDLVSLENTVEHNLKNLAHAKKCSVSDLRICILNRPRHEELIAKVRESGAKIQLITDGDVAGVIATTRPETYIDMYMGSGGAPEGVLAAAALKCIGGQMNGKLIFKNEDEKKYAKKLGVKDLNKIYSVEEMVRSDVVFVATGVTDGWMLKGVKKINTHSWFSESLVMHYSEASTRIVQTIANS